MAQKITYNFEISLIIGLADLSPDRRSGPRPRGRRLDSCGRATFFPSVTGKWRATRRSIPMTVSKAYSRLETEGAPFAECEAREWKFLRSLAKRLA